MAKEKFVITPLSPLPSSKRNDVHNEIVSTAPTFHRVTVQGILDRVTTEFAAIEAITGCKLLPIPASDTP